MKKTFIIKIKNIKFKAKSREEAENIAIDIVNDIGHYGKYELLEPKDKKEENTNKKLYMNETKRIQRKRTKGWKMPENTIYIGRLTKWGNPFRVGELWNNKSPITQEQAINLYKKYVAPFFTETQLKELRGKDLACWCPLDKPCHADILLKLAQIK